MGNTQVTIVREENSNWLYTNLVHNWGAQPVQIAKHSHGLSANEKPRKFCFLFTAGAHNQTIKIENIDYYGSAWC